jgi:hypothetical protein
MFTILKTIMSAKRLAAAMHSGGPDIPKWAAPRRERDALGAVTDLIRGNAILNETRSTYPVRSLLLNSRVQEILLVRGTTPVAQSRVEDPTCFVKNLVNGYSLHTQVIAAGRLPAVVSIDAWAARNTCR